MILPKIMNRWGNRRVQAAFWGAVALLAATTGLTLWALTKGYEETAWVERTDRILASLGELRGELRAAESAEEAFLLTGDERFLSEYFSSQSAARGKEELLRLLWAQAGSTPGRLATLSALMEKDFELMDEGVAARRDGRAASAHSLLDRGGHGRLLASLEAELSGIDAEQRAVLERQSSARARIRLASRAGVAGGSAIALMILLAAARALRQDIRARTVAEASLEAANARLQERMKQLVAQREEIGLLGEMGSFLIASLNWPEVETLLARQLQKLFPGTSGAVYMVRDPGDALPRLCSWPPEEPIESSLAPEDCWGLRRGQPSLAEEESPAMRCAHVHSPARFTSLCVPMSASGETAGLLHIRFPENVPPGEEALKLAAAAAGQAGLALSNLRLRENLRAQSIRDALTGLFNRRYLDEALPRELARSARSGQSVGIVLFDLDHFKRLNDDSGHLAGDAVLREIGALVRKTLRGGDIACRYGGEEFILVLPDASLDASARRAEALREAIGRTSAEFKGQRLGPLTASFGVAVFPLHGSTPEEILEAGDRALYRAKSEGRNRVALAGAAEPRPAEVTSSSPL